MTRLAVAAFTALESTPSADDCSVGWSSPKHREITPESVKIRKSQNNASNTYELLYLSGQSEEADVVIGHSIQHMALPIVVIFTISSQFLSIRVA